MLETASLVNCLHHVSLNVASLVCLCATMLSSRLAIMLVSNFPEKPTWLVNGGQKLVAHVGLF